MDRGPSILGDLDLNGHIKHFTEYFPPSRPSHAIAYICVRLFFKKQGNKLRVIRIDLLQTKYLSWLLNTLPNFFHLDCISIIFMLPKPKIWKIRVYGPISEIFWDLILPRWIIRIVFYKIVCHIIFHKIFAYFIMSNSGLFSFPFL